MGDIKIDIYFLRSQMFKFKDQQIWYLVLAKIQSRFNLDRYHSELEESPYLHLKATQ